MKGKRSGLVLGYISPPQVEITSLESGLYIQLHLFSSLQVWQFSTLFSPVDTWCFQEVAPISEHIKVCPYYERESRSEKIHLPHMREEIHTNKSCKASTLVTLFQHKRIMM